MNLFSWHKCPICKVGEMCGIAIAKIGADFQTCNHCGFKRQSTFLFCEVCQRADSAAKFKITKSTFLHIDSQCRFKSIHKTSIKSNRDSSRALAATSYEIEKGKFIDYLAQASFEEINTLWERKAWLNPDSIQGASNLDDDDIKKSIEQIRRVKFKNVG
jgi:hypothetical protein